MANYCSNCGNAVDEKAVICVKCGCALKKDQVEEIINPPEKDTGSSAGVILGILGIVFAFIFALIGHILSIAGIIAGIKTYKTSNRPAGLIVSVIGEVFSVFSSLIGILLVLI